MHSVLVFSPSGSYGAMMMTPSQSSVFASQSSVLILGGGFAGLRLARLLARNGPRITADGTPVRVTVIDRSAAFTYTPLLYEVASGKVDPLHIVTPFHDMLWDGAIAFRQANVTGIDLSGRIVQTDNGELPYDRLVLAPGAASTLPHGSDRTGLAAHALPFMTLDDARAIRAHIVRQFERVRGMAEPPAGALTFVVAGGGAKGVELIFDLADFIERRLAPEHGVPRAWIRLVLIDAEQRLMYELPPVYDRVAQEAMRARGIRLLVNTRVVGMDGSTVSVSGGRTIPARTLIWAAGISAHPLVRALGLPLREQALPVTDALQLPEYPAVYAAGDAVWTDDGTGRRAPATASVAQQHGRFLARALTADLAGTPLPTFRYTPRGNIIKLGEGDAVAQLGGTRTPHFTGRAAFALRSAFDLVEVPGLAQKRGTFTDLLDRMSP